jgi:uncharacterized membrane protein
VVAASRSRVASSAFAELARRDVAQTVPMIVVFADAGAGDPETAEAWEEYERRRQDARVLIGSLEPWLREDLDVESATDVWSGVFSHAPVDALMRRRGWSLDRYVAFLDRRARPAAAPLDRPSSRGDGQPGWAAEIGALHPRRMMAAGCPLSSLRSPGSPSRRPVMAEQKNDTLFVIAAAYDDVDAAVMDYEAVKDLYREVKTSHDFDAAVIAKDDAGEVRIVRKHEEPTRHGAAVGLRWGLATGVVAALFPPIGIGIAAVGAGAGAAIGGVAGHASDRMGRGDLKDLGEALDAGQAGLIAVYEMNLADQIAANIKAANRIVSRATDMAADQLAEDLKRAEAASAAAIPQQEARSPESTETPTLRPR